MAPDTGLTHFAVFPIGRTTSINAELTKDASLSALKIDVDTSQGRVALRGTAPDAASRDRATVLAQRVDGVVSVENQLQVKAN